MKKIKLSSVIIKNKEKNSNGEIHKVHSISNKNGLVDQTDMFENRVIASDDLSNYYIIRKNAIAYNPSRIDVGSVVIKSNSEPGVISPLYISFYVDSNLYNQFILINWFKSRDFHKQASRLYEGSVRNTLSFDQLKYFKIPNIDLEKQEGIANTLSSIDQLIEDKESLLNKKRIEKNIIAKKILPLTKKNMDYETIGNLCYITTGKLDANAMCENGKYKFFTCAKDVFSIDDYAFNCDALLVSGNGSQVGHIHSYNGKFNAYQRTYILHSFIYSKDYIYQYLKLYLKRRINEEVFASNIPFIKLDTLKEMMIPKICNKDQVKIATLLSSMDNLIELHKQELEELKQMKKYYLNKVFK